MNIECQVPYCTVGSFSKGESFKRICQKHFLILVNNDFPDCTDSIQITSVQDIQKNIDYPYQILKSALHLCLDEISKKSQELEILQKKISSQPKDVADEKRSQPGNISCSDCGKKFNQKYRLAFHRKTVHGASRKFMCQHCGATFKRLDGLKVHEKKSHSMNSRILAKTEENNKKSFQCEICDKILSSRFNLSGHMKSFHTGERPNLCRTCGKAYATAAALKTHEKFHILPFSCGICGKGLPDATRFKDHLNSHEEKALKCSACGKKFSHRNSLKIHQKLHQVGDRKSFNCKFCTESFTLSSYLRKHEKRCKKKPPEM
ncbi:hypothetical protein DMENIID0001_115200 [Sergentomyia squamirostris]